MPIRIALMAGVGRLVRARRRPNTHPFQPRIGRMHDLLPKLPPPLSQMRNTKGLPVDEAQLENDIPEELSLRGREETVHYSGEVAIPRLRRNAPLTLQTNRESRLGFAGAKREWTDKRRRHADDKWVRALSSSDLVL